MRALKRKVAAMFLGLMVLASASADDGAALLYKESLEQLQIAYPTGAALQKPGSVPARSMRFNAFGRHFDVDLEDNRALLDSAQRVVLGNRLHIYRGVIANKPSSWVRLVTVNDVPRGMLWDGEEFWAIDVETDGVTGAEKPFIYRLSDVQIAPGTLGCSAHDVIKDGSELAKIVSAEVADTASQAPGASLQIDLAVIGDFEFTSAKGANADVELATRMNNVDGIFSADLGVQLNVNRIDTYTSDNDPFSGETDSGALLDELSDHRFATAAQNANGLTHLFTGRDMDGSTVGVAWTGALCLRRHGAGLTQGTHSTSMDSLIAAHEIGHNFGAPHDGTSGSACESETGEFLMAARLNGSNQFSSCSISQMQDDVNRASCISPLESTDLAMVTGSQPIAVLLGDTATITFDANNVGIETATNVDVNVTIPAGVALNSIAATSGTCTSGAGSASCTIDSIAVGSGVTVTVTATTSSVGTANVIASVSASADADTTNNQATAQLAVDPAVDLVLTAAAGAELTLNSSTTLSPTVENRSVLAASNVTLTVTPVAGLTVNSASWSPGTCNVSNNVVTCQAGNLAAQANDSLQLNVTGSSIGSLSYSMSIDATEVDRDTASNNVSGQVSVSSGGPTTPPPDEEDGGAGSFGWLSLLMLLLVRMSASGTYRRDP